jgi:hypothetical protein
LSVESDPPGASILVDGIEKGEAGTKNPIAVTLVLLHGSISIETDVPYADVLLDGTIKGQSPCVFGNLTPGEHAIKICDVLQEKGS